MTVTLTKRTEEIVQEQLRTGRYATPDEVINHLIEEQFELDRIDAPPAPARDELEASLLRAMEKPTKPYRSGDLVAAARRAIERAGRE